MEIQTTICVENRYFSKYVMHSFDRSIQNIRFNGTSFEMLSSILQNQLRAIDMKWQGLDYWVSEDKVWAG